MKYISIKGQLARLLATENLIVEHDPKASTACFDVENRILTLPVINTASEYVYNMLIGHEVGHALWTPKDWVSRSNNRTPKAFLNVIEDVRIEKMIQNKFPGLRKDFSKGYDELDEQDFFEIAGKDPNKFNFIDRINLHFKLGARRMIKFSDEEMKFVEAISNCETYDDVARVAHELAVYMKQRQEDEPAQPNKPTKNSKGSGEGEPVESDGYGEPSDDDDMEEGDDDSSKSVTSGDDEEEDDSDEDGEGKDGKEGEDGDAKDSVEGDGEGSGEDGNDGKDGKDSSKEAGEGGKTAGSGNAQNNLDEEVSKTQQSFDEALGKITQGSHVGYVYIDRPTYKLDKEIVSLDDVSVSYRRGSSEDYPNAVQKYQDFIRTSKSEVSHMVSRFEMKKSADAYAKQETRKTGVLDTRLLHQYKIQDDIFKRNTVDPTGKNHGMVMMLDFSGSMSSLLKATMEQIIILIEFCKKVGIPYDVYTFTSKSYGGNYSTPSVNQSVPISHCQICHVISSSSRHRDNLKNITNLYAYCRKRCDSSHLTMGGTPLNNALFSVPAMLEEFVKKTRAQKVSFVCVTDGESERLSLKNSLNNSYSDKILVRQKNGQVFDLGSGETGRIANWIESVCPFASVTNIYLGDIDDSASYAHKNKHTLEKKVFEAENCSSSTSDTSWPTICCVDPESFNRTRPQLKSSDGDYGMAEYLATKKSVKVILTTIVDDFA